ncbi:MAG: hypothetical protein HYW26_02190 [Candidatus Aenigmarchaeota archaeon]|nr:hypothetical protein [Candidatus Aenigmarchaeota archaeon]
MATNKNKRSKPKPRHIDLFGTQFLMPKGQRKKLNKQRPELKNKRLNASHLTKLTESQKNQEE